MATVNESGFRTFQATSTAIERAVRVKLDSNGLISAAGVGEAWIGTTVEAIAADGYGAVQLINNGTHLMTASAAIARGAVLWATASGKIDDADPGLSIKIGFSAMEAATADGDIIECIPTDE